MVDDKQAIEKLERDGWDCEEIECDDHLAVVLEEAPPNLPGIATPAHTSEVTRHGPLAETKSEFQKFAVDSGRSPARILLRQATDERAEFFAYSRSAEAAPRSPTPIPAEDIPVPPYTVYGFTITSTRFPAGP